MSETNTSKAMTPPMHVKGRFSLKAPWAADSAVIYECIAIRSFEDVYKLGEDVYRTYYEPMGLLDNQAGFSFAVETAKQPNIVTLKGSDKSIVYVPDTYILGYPQMGDVKYHHVVLTASLGGLPEYVDLEGLKEDVSNLISARVGADTTVEIMTAPSENQPTAEQHEILEAARTGSISVYENDYTKLMKLKRQNEELAQKVNSLVSVLKHNDLL